MAFCTSTKIEHYHNQGYSPTPISSDLKLGFSNIKTSYENGILQCSFRRVKEIAAEIKHFSVIDKKYYILFAHGTGTGQYGYHSNNKVASDEEFDFNVKVQALTTGTSNEQSGAPVEVATTQSPPQPETGSPLSSTQLAITTTAKGGAVYIADNFELRWINKEFSTDFVFRTSGIQANYWSAFALSKDNKMVFHFKVVTLTI